MVVRRSTIPWVRYNPANNSLRSMVNSMLTALCAVAPLLLIFFKERKEQS
jgi:hypothetical protein